MRGRGSVTLVGAGPGDPGLLTLAGMRALRSAEVVLYDRLVGAEILAMIPENAERVNVGKKAEHHPVPQEEINGLILDRAERGKRVVRLKGGDPYLFGRGAEELEAVCEAGIPFREIPGISSAIAAPAYGGIPVTHRDYASSVHIITGHAREGGRVSVPYESLVKLGGTLIFLMGVAAIGTLAEGLMRAGMDGDTPAALVENGTRPEQRRLTAPLAEIAERARGGEYRPPSVLIVGKVCALARELDWFSRLPLLGTRVLVTRPRAAAGELSAMLRDKGCAVTEFPCIRTEPLPVDGALFERLERYAWIVLTSPVGARLFLRRMRERRVDLRRLPGVRFAVVGEKTAAVLEENGVFADYMPESYTARSLAEGMRTQLSGGERVLLFRARMGTPRLGEELRACGAAVDEVDAYDTLYECPEADGVREALRSGAIDYITFTSASTVHGFVQALPGLVVAGPRCVCIGPETAAAAEACGFRAMVSEAATIESLAACIEADHAARNSGGDALS